MLRKQCEYMIVLCQDFVCLPSSLSYNSGQSARLQFRYLQFQIELEKYPLTEDYQDIKGSL